MPAEPSVDSDLQDLGPALVPNMQSGDVAGDVSSAIPSHLQPSLVCGQTVVADFGEEKERFAFDVFREFLWVLLCEELHGCFVFEYGVCVSRAGVQMLLAEWRVQPGFAAFKVHVPRESSRWRSADHATFTIKPIPQHSSPKSLLEERLVSHVLADLDESPSLTERQYFCQLRVVCSFKFLLETQLASGHPNFYFSVTVQNLVEPQFFPRVFFEGIPVLNEVYQDVVTLKVLQAKHKNHLSLQSHQGFVTLAKPSIQIRTYHHTQIWGKRGLNGNSLIRFNGTFALFSKVLHKLLIQRQRNRIFTFSLGEVERRELIE